MARKKIINPSSRVKTLTLDGKEFQCEYNFRAYAAMKELSGISLLNGWGESEMDAKEYACLLYSGLLTHQPDIDIEFCFNALSGENFAEVVKVLFEAYRASLPKPKETDENPKKPIAKTN